MLQKGSEFFRINRKNSGFWHRRATSTLTRADGGQRYACRRCHRLTDKSTRNTPDSHGRTRCASGCAGWLASRIHRGIGPKGCADRRMRAGYCTTTNCQIVRLANQVHQSTNSWVGWRRSTGWLTGTSHRPGASHPWQTT